MGWYLIYEFINQFYDNEKFIDAWIDKASNLISIYTIKLYLAIMEFQIVMLIMYIQILCVLIITVR